MKRFLAVTALLAVSGSANATECKGLLSIIGIDTGFSCEQRAAMMGTGAAMMQSAQPTAPAPVQLLPPPAPPPAPILVMPTNGASPVWIIPTR